MAFQEASAWIMCAALLIGGAFYAVVLASASAALGVVAPPLPPAIGLSIAVLVVLSIVGHVVVAIASRRTANAAPDERERIASLRSSRMSGTLFGGGVLLALGAYLLTFDGNLLFHAVVGSLVLAQIAEYGSRIVLLRTAL